ncbi:hypothetical protein C8J56DRAFT_145925 [Mycena floridula]|nr:hypothetical protein C8J56DRAFT_145925 [Mycena floridula]
MLFSSLFRRHYSRAFSSQHSIYISESTNPYFNLSAEDWLFRHKNPEEPLLLLYRDSPCVVIGRNQNPWKEVNLQALGEIPFIRRRSGGGTVYHDLGNTNFSIHLPRKSFDRHATARLILRAVRSMGIDARVNDRNDICIGDEKVSGSAYKIVNKRAYHHGTMLISTDLSTLGKLLHSDKDTMITKGVASVRSPVCNIQKFDASASHEAFVKAVTAEFRREYGTDDSAHIITEADLNNVSYVDTGISELSSWTWAYGQTPEFTYTTDKDFGLGNVRINVAAKHGLITACSIHTANAGYREELGRVEKNLVGKRYGFVDLEIPTWSGDLADIRHWVLAVLGCR